MDKAFAYNVAKDVISDIDDQEPMTIEDCWQRNDWPKWKDDISY